MHGFVKRSFKRAVLHNNGTKREKSLMECIVLIRLNNRFVLINKISHTCLIGLREC